jgi:FkbM family methyltransferase
LTGRPNVVDRGALLDELGALLDEAPVAARRREERLITELDGGLSAATVLFGAGNLGRRTLALLRAHGREVAAFVDNDPHRWGTAVEGVPVLSPDEASSRFASDGLAIVTIWRAEGGHDYLLTRAELNRRGWRRVESFIPLYWGLASDALPYLAIDVPTNILAAGDEVMAAAALWADEVSLDAYVKLVHWRLTADFAALPSIEPNQYFAAGVVSVGDDEVFVDCGAFTGDTLVDVASRVGSWRSYHAFEPDPASFEALATAVATLPSALAERVHLYRAATADRPGTARFQATGLGSASLSAKGTYAVECVAIDDVLAEAPTFIKMDIEGAEADALRGAERSIRQGRPLLAISAYHRQADLWELPRQIHEMVPEYELFLRPHVAEGFDTVLYAVRPA